MNGRVKGGGVAGSLVEEWVALVLLHSFDYFMCEEETNKTEKKRKIEWRRKEKKKEKKKNTVRQIQLGYLELTVCVTSFTKI